MSEPRILKKYANPPSERGLEEPTLWVEGGPVANLLRRLIDPERPMRSADREALELLDRLKLHD